MKEYKNKKQLIEIVKISSSITDVLRKMGLSATGGNHNNIKSWISKYRLDTSHFRKVKSYGSRIRDIGEILKENKKVDSRTLKRWLISSQLLEEVCAKCNIGPIWKGQPLFLQIDHVNGNHNDNRIENLRFLCPNCHSQTETWGSKRRKTVKQIFYCICGNVKNKKSKRCMTCSTNNKKKVLIRPNKLKLNKMIKILGIAGTGREFSVSSSTIKRWLGLGC